MRNIYAYSKGGSMPNFEFSEIKLPCIVCGKIMDAEVTDHGLTDDGITAKIHGGCLSNHDSDEYLMTICDECVTACYVSGKLKFIKNYSDTRILKPSQFMTDADIEAAFMTDADIEVAGIGVPNAYND
jgi:hypothetical protein